MNFKSILKDLKIYIVVYAVLIFVLYALCSQIYGYIMLGHVDDYEDKGIYTFSPCGMTEQRHEVKKKSLISSFFSGEPRYVERINYVIDFCGGENNKYNFQQKFRDKNVAEDLLNRKDASIKIKVIEPINDREHYQLLKPEYTIQGYIDSEKSDFKLNIGIASLALIPFLLYFRSCLKNFNSSKNIPKTENSQELEEGHNNSKQRFFKKDHHYYGHRRNNNK